ncbi:MAG TPA: adenylate/guanylate cyclase domain-containing protein, partial [Spirochaetota bacterium]|nr:adenylate/guanylate cyclase domain-containing protein [Spirochaetota bacterium]
IRNLSGNFIEDTDKLEKEIKGLEAKLDKTPKENSVEIENIETKINELKNKLEFLKKDFNLSVFALNELEKNSLGGITEAIFINNKNSYTIIYPIIMEFGEKAKHFGTIIASISTNFIKQKTLEIIVISSVIAVLVFILSIIIIQFYMKIIVSPIITLTKGVKAVADGNLDMKVPVNGKDELAILGEEFNNMTRIWREKLHMEKYVSKSTVKMISQVETGEYNKEPKRDYITVFFSDVRGFTSYSEKHDPLDVVKNLNKLFDIQVAIIEKNDGDIDKFVGDEIMAVFPSPQNAFKASIDIQHEMEKFNKDKKEKLEIGIGINSGDAVVGSIGSGNHFDWTAIGDTVNLGARLCSAAKPGKIVLSEECYKQLKTNLQYEQSQISVKGKEKPINIYTF